MWSHHSKFNHFCSIHQIVRSLALSKVSGLRNRLEEDNSRKAVWVGSAAFAGV